MAQAGTVRADDIEIAYGFRGNDGAGTPLVLVMGYGCTMDLWPPALTDKLSADRRVVLFDNRGMGLSTDSDKEITIELLADDVAGLAAALGLPRVHILGWSMGAMIAQEVALRHPEKIGKIVLYAGHCGEKEAGLDEKTWGMLTDVSGTIEERIDRMFRLLFPASWLEGHPDRSSWFPPFTEPVKDESAVAQARAMSRWTGAGARLHRIAAPTLLVTGTEDMIIPPDNALAMTRKIHGASLIRIEGGGHGVMYQCPLKLARLIAAFLED
jgi:pimeloyl-ACP methyl ester carboxylesterase